MGCFTRLPFPVRARRGFTIIELLTVVAIITLLIGLILPAVASVKRKARKTNEINNVRQIGSAWQNYAVGSNDACLPGYLNRVTQLEWAVQYSYQNGSIIPAETSARTALGTHGPRRCDKVATPTGLARPRRYDAKRRAPGERRSGSAASGRRLTTGRDRPRNPGGSIGAMASNAGAM